MMNIFNWWKTFIGSPYTQGYHWKTSLISMIFAGVALFVSVVALANDDNYMPITSNYCKTVECQLRILQDTVRKMKKKIITLEEENHHLQLEIWQVRDSINAHKINEHN